LGEHLLCKQGVNGSIPFSSTRLHSLFPRGHLDFGPVTDEQDRVSTWKQAARAAVSIPPKGGPSAKTRKTVWMFDNEIDWVIAHLGNDLRTGRLVKGDWMDRAAGDANTRPSTL
jgi:hypothetical protein